MSKREHLNTAHHPPKWWYRYVDDSHVCIAREHLREFHSHLDFNTPDLKQKKTKTDLLHFWNQDNRNPFGTTKTSVYRKATHTDKYLQFSSHHPCNTNAQQLEPYRLLTDADKLSEVQHVVDALMVTLTNLLEAVKEPQHPQINLKPKEVQLLCRTFKELQKESQEL